MRCIHHVAMEMAGGMYIYHVATETAGGISLIYTLSKFNMIYNI